MSLAEQFAWAGGAALVLWLAGLGLAMLATRNGTVVPGPATQELGEHPEPPAVVSLLADGWRSNTYAAAATVLDLADKGLIELRQAGDRAGDTTVHVRGADGAAAPPSDAELAPYERRVLARVAERAGATGAPIGAIAFRGQERSDTWNRQLREEVIAEARRRGLSRPRFGNALQLVLAGSALVAPALFALAVLCTGRVYPAAVIGSLVFSACIWLFMRVTGERATEAGLARAGHWLGLRSWLVAHEEFAALPPALVTVWDRYLAYGCALGVTTRANQLLVFDTGDKRRVWSSYGGTWRAVRIRYPRLLPGFGRNPSLLLQLVAGAATVTVGLYLFGTLRQPDWAVTTGPDAEHSLRRPVLLLNAGWVGIVLLGVLIAGKLRRWTLLVAFLSMFPLNYAGEHGWGGMDAFETGLLPVETAGVVVAGALTLFLAGQLVAGRTGVRTLTGEVLRLEARRSASAARFLAVDEGTEDRTTAWALPPGRASFHTGDVVRLTVERGTRRVRSVHLVAAGSESAPEPEHVPDPEHRTEPDAMAPASAGN
ncbi:hypothetical protein [Streptomyces sp. NPDC089919]|uniref:DUF2207 family protein n=1 Tax=Streptomyces sp. NPDC089919 TaxID=3155188 RepID=UPI0034191DCB